MSGEHDEMVAAGYQSLARLQAAFEAAVESVVSEVQQATGERLLVRQPGVLDAGREDLARMAEQTRRYAEAWRLICTWLQPGDTRSLGSLLKVIPAHIAHEITAHLRAAGVLPADGPRQSP